MKDKKRVSANKPKQQDDGTEFATPSAQDLEKMLRITGEELSKLQELSDKPLLIGKGGEIMAYMDALYKRAVNGDTEAEALFRSFAQEIHDAAEKVSNESGDTSAKRKNSKLPDLPLLLSDIPAKSPKIKQHELVGVSSAFYIFQIAKADYEAKRGALALKLLRLRDIEEGNIEAKIDPDGVITLTDWSSSGPALVYKLI